MFIALLLTAFAGFVLLALTMDRHGAQLLTRPLPRRLHRPGALAGWALLVLSAAIGVEGWGWGTGLTLWSGSAAIAATALAGVLAYRPRLALYGAALAPVALLALLA
ncbi:DUF3325 domain-containing protein [Rhodocista pekingensis]|uniref:DUF3325 domain-containing protein n=1 Tax=Rhodocista pekingensis TaxID=201185 RepID=A0ABW2L2H4_9PROT